jgi:hypothetical protein
MYIHHHAAPKPLHTKTNRLMLRCDNCKLLMFANGHLSQTQLKALPNVVVEDQRQQHYDFNNNNSNNRYW